MRQGRPSPHDREKERREKEFQRRVLAALERPKASRLLLILNSAFFLWLLTLFIVTFGGGYYTAYQRCVANAQSVANNYMKYGFEILYREKDIVSAIGEAKSIKDVREALDKKSYFNSDLKDKSISELSIPYRAAYLRVDRPDAPAARAMMSSPLFARFNLVFQGYLSPDIKDSDLPDLKRYAGLVGVAELEEMLQRISTIYELECSPHKVFQIAIGEDPILVRARLTSFTESERHDLRLDQ